LIFANTLAGSGNPYPKARPAPPSDNRLAPRVAAAAEDFRNLRRDVAPDGRIRPVFPCCIAFLLAWPRGPFASRL